MPSPLLSALAPVLPERPGIGLTASSGAGAPVGKDRSAEALSRQFEQLLVRQMLSQMRSTSLSGDEQGGGPSAAYLQMADDHLAGIVASVGGLGLGHSVRRWMQGVQAYQNAAAQSGPVTQTAPSLPGAQNPPNAPALPKLPG
jgi:Rod binding domain-containing protein